VSSRKGR